MSASARRTDSGIGAGRSASTRMRPRASTIDAIAFARIVPGFASRPPQFPEWCPPLRRSTTRSKLNAPREPRKIVGRSERRRGPSDAISRSADSASALRSQTWRSPGEPTSSPISIRSFTLKPSRPRAASTRTERGEIDRMLALVVGRAAPEPAPVFFRYFPRRAACGPLLVVARDDVAVAIRQHRRQRRILDALGEAHRWRARGRVVPDRPAKSEPLDGGADLLGQVARELGRALALLALRAKRDAPAHVGEQPALVEPGGRSSYSVSTLHGIPTPRTSRKRGPRSA